MNQPQPITSTQSQPVTAAVIELLRQREAKGVKTYGQTLHTFNGRDALQDAIEEAADLLQYLVQLKMEHDHLVAFARVFIGDTPLSEATEDTARLILAQWNTEWSSEAQAYAAGYEHGKGPVAERLAEVEAERDYLKRWQAEAIEEMKEACGWVPVGWEDRLEELINSKDGEIE